MSAAAGFSICLWFSFDTVGFFERLFDFGLGPDNNNVLVTRSGQSNLLELYVGGWALYSPNPIVLSTWRHVCVVNQRMSWKLYDNGILSINAIKDSDLASVDLISNFIGKSNWDGDSLFQGKMDEFKMFSRSLSDSEVSDVFTDSHSTIILQCDSATLHFYFFESIDQIMHVCRGCFQHLHIL
jgi:hypothetical protein